MFPVIACHLRLKSSELSGQRLTHTIILVVQSKGQIAEDASPDPSQFIRNGASPGFNITGKLDDNHTAVASAAISGAPDQAETDHMASVSCRSADTPTNIMSMFDNPPVLLFPFWKYYWLFMNISFFMQIMFRPSPNHNGQIHLVWMIAR